MPITFDCACGQTLQVSDVFAGLAIHCKHCGQSATVPAPAGKPTAPPAPVPMPAPAPRPLATSPPPPAAPPGPKVPTDLKKGSGVGEPPPPQAEASRDEGMFSGGAVAGSLMMLGAFVWFIVGYAAGRIYFYPPVLFIIGLGTFVKGWRENK